MQFSLLLCKFAPAAPACLELYIIPISCQTSNTIFTANCEKNPRYFEILLLLSQNHFKVRKSIIIACTVIIFVPRIRSREQT